MPEKPKIVFLLGLARSGTKLFRNLLNNHSEISLLPLESNFIPKLAGRFGNIDLESSEAFHRLYQAVAESVYAYNLKITGGTLIGENEWYNSCSSYDLGSVFRTFFEVILLRTKPSAKIIGDKTPYYIYHVTLLLELFPDASFIHLVRDPRDRALSEKKTWGKSMQNSVNTWVQGVQRLHEALGNYSKRLIEVRYEDLLANPEFQLERVVKFLGLSSQQGLNTLDGSPEKYGDARGAREIVASNVQKFEGNITPSKLRRLEELSLPWLRHYDYPVEFAKTRRSLPEGKRKLLALYDKFSLARFHVRDKGVIEGLRYFRKIAL